MQGSLCVWNHKHADVLTHLRFESFCVIAFQVSMFLIKLGELNKFREAAWFLGSREPVLAG